MTIYSLSQGVPAVVSAFFLLQLLSPAPARGADVTVIDRAFYNWPQLIERLDGLPKETHDLALTIAYFPAAGWQRDTVIAVARKGVAILAQCAVRLATLEIVALQGDRYFQDFRTPAARELAQRIPLSRPTVYFVADTLQRPAFDAEAIGRGNSRTRPEIADTVWITRGARDLELVLAHELAHVLMDSGEHSTLPGNLMHEETAPQNVSLTANQCKRLRQSATAHGLLAPRP